MTPLIECVPNFSEGRDPQVIDALALAVRRVADVHLLDLSSGRATNRTVLTFVGPPAAMREAAWSVACAAATRIDMQHHTGVHPRQGAMDVCPFVPLAGATLSDCIDLARTLGQRVGEELHIPVYLYGAAAQRPERQDLALLRRGGYEALAEKLAAPEWQPDFGPAKLHVRAGATAIGARELMVAYNVNLETQDAAVAQAIAAQIRTKGRVRRDAQGHAVKDKTGGALRDPGLPHCFAAGWFIPEYGCAQVTMNLTNFRVTGLHTVFGRIAELAQAQGIGVSGSEVIGLLPEAALLAAGQHFASVSSATTYTPEQLIQLAIEGLGLAALTPFDPTEKVLDYRLRAL